MVRVGGSDRSEEQEEDFIKDEAMTEADRGWHRLRGRWAEAAASSGLILESLSIC